MPSQGFTSGWNGVRDWSRGAEGGCRNNNINWLDEAQEAKATRRCYRQYNNNNNNNKNNNNKNNNNRGRILEQG